MTRVWRVKHACFLRWVEGAEANCRQPSSCNLCLGGGDNPAETGP
jgi:hypothetical protein